MIENSIYQFFNERKLHLWKEKITEFINYIFLFNKIKFNCNKQNNIIMILK
jgi:hypothetical protein